MPMDFTNVLVLFLTVGLVVVHKSPAGLLMYENVCAENCEVLKLCNASWECHKMLFWG